MANLLVFPECTIRPPMLDVSLTTTWPSKLNVSHFTRPESFDDGEGLWYTEDFEESRQHVSNEKKLVV